MMQNKPTPVNDLRYAFITEDLLRTLRTMELHKVAGCGYSSSYTRTNLADRLHDVFDFETNMEFISEKTIKTSEKAKREIKYHASQ